MQVYSAPATKPSSFVWDNLRFHTAFHGQSSKETWQRCRRVPFKSLDVISHKISWKTKFLSAIIATLISLTTPTLAFPKNGSDFIPHSSNDARITFTVPTADGTKFPFFGNEILSYDGARLRYYSSDNSSRELPLVIFLPGSGCAGAFSISADNHRTAGPEAFALQFKANARLIVMENPGIENRFARETGIDCSPAFQRMENLEVRVAALQAVVDDVRSRNWLHPHFMIVAGSEGVAWATRFATSSTNVSHLLLISGFGIGQPLATVHAALTGWGNWSFVGDEPSGAQGRLRSTLARWEQVRRGTDLEGGKTIAGHDQRYWRSIGTASPAEDALGTAAQLYVVQGGSDESSPAVNYEAGLAYLVAHNRPFVSEYIPCGDHFLICQGDGGVPRNLQDVITHGMEWFLTGRLMKSSVAVFNPFDALR